MPGLLLIIAAQASAVAPAPPADIVVVGQRMDRVVTAVRIRQKTREADCWVTKSSGDPRIDWQMCEIAKECAKTVPLKRDAQHACYADAKQRFLQSYSRRS